MTTEQFDIRTMYRHLSRKFNDGTDGCPTDKSMGECPCLERMESYNHRYRAYLYIWRAGFHLTAAQVAGWFTEAGAQDVFITHVLHDPYNDTLEGTCNDGAKNWLVEFQVPTSAPTEAPVMTTMVDAAMVEMQNIHPPLKRSECERLIRAALEAVQD